MKSSILLMYISEKSGHHSATLSIERAIKAQNPEIKVLNINGFKHISPIMEKIINTLYMNAIHSFPQLWDFLYDNPAIEFKLKGLKESVNKRKRDKIKRLVGSNNCKVVICSQAFPCGVVAEYKKKYFSDLILIAVVTDFTPHSYWIYEEVNFYIVASESAKNMLMNKGIDENKIKILGIPIDQKFSQQLDKASVAKELNLDSNKASILVMGGSRGFGPMKSLIKSLEKSSIDANFLIVAGSNKSLFKWLKKKKFSKRMHIYPQIDYVDKLMTVSDILISKPGGITTAESISKNLPILIINPIPGQEENNTNYLLNEGLAVKANNIEDAVTKLSELLNDEEKLISIRKRTSKLAKPYSSVKIAELALNLC